MRLRYFAAGFLSALLIAVVSTAHAHRLSGKPRTLEGKLELAKAQVRHDKAAGDKHWLGRDRHYVQQLRRLLRPTRPFPDWWMRQAMCVHRGEGAWNDPGPPFYGGMQFAASTWLNNGGGRFAPYAHLASPLEQLTVAYWLWRRAGWGPWPNTSRMCGLR